VSLEIHILGKGRGFPNSASTRRRKNASRRSPLEALECRALLSGDTLATATVINLQDDQPDQFTDEIGNEGHGNLDVDLYQVSLTQGTTLVLSGNEVSPRDQIQAVVNQLTVLSNGSDSAYLLAAKNHAAAAVEALDNGPHVGVAFLRVESATIGLWHAVQSGAIGTDVAAGLANSMSGAARNMAQNVHDYAEGVGGTADKLAVSQEFLDEADGHRDHNHFLKAIQDYRRAGWKAHQAAHGVGQADASQALNSLILTFRLFDSSGNEIAEVHGQGGITLTLPVASSGTYYIGISGNDNFEYEPEEEESGEEGSTGCYEFEVEVDAPPIVLSAQAVLVDPVVVIDEWEISGTVEDEFPEGVTINFGGILEGHSVQVNADGTFTYRVVIDKNLPNTEGLVTATAVDGMGQESAAFEFSIDPGC
jgi:hypothetical protein